MSNAFQNGLAGVLDGVDYVRQGFREGEEKRRRNTLADLMGQAAQGGQADLSGIARAGGDPFKVQDWQQGQQDRSEAEVGQIAALIAGADPTRRPEIYAQSLPRLQAFAARRGLPLKPVWDDSLLPEVQQIAQVWGKNATGVPAEVQAFNAFAKGLSPEDQAKARRVQLGLDPRASSGLPFAPLEFVGPDGRTYTQAFDKRTGQAAAPNSGNASAPNVMDLTQALALAGGKITSGYRDPGHNAQVVGVPNSQHMGGTARDWVAPNPQVKAQVRDWAQRQGWEVIDEGDHLHFEVPPQASPYVSPTPGAIKADETRGGEQAKVDVQVENADVIRELEAKLAAAKARATQVGEAEGKGDASIITRERNATQSGPLLDEAEKLLATATGGRVGAARDAAAGAFGYGTLGSQANESLKILAAKLTASVPRFEGPQSNIDVQFYKDAAGDLANENKPVSVRLAALQTMRRLNAKYAAPQSGPSSSLTPAQRKALLDRY